MLQQLRCTSHSVVILPIPGRRLLRRDSQLDPASGIFRIGYFGNLYDYAPMLGELLDASQGQGDVKFELRGSNPNWSASRVQMYLEKKVLLPYASESDFETWLLNLDAVLCVASFDLRTRRLMETNFPSKLIEALQFGKPIILWGPEYSSAIQWARDKQACYCITESDPGAVMRELKILREDGDLQRRLATTAVDLATTEFSFEAIQGQFMSLLTSLHSRTKSIGNDGI